MCVRVLVRVYVSLCAGDVFVCLCILPVQPAQGGSRAAASSSASAPPRAGQPGSGSDRRCQSSSPPPPAPVPGQPWRPRRGRPPPATPAARGWGPRPCAPRCLDPAQARPVDIRSVFTSLRTTLPSLRAGAALGWNAANGVGWACAGHFGRRPLRLRVQAAASTTSWPRNPFPRLAADEEACSTSGRGGTFATVIGSAPMLKQALQRGAEVSAFA